MGLSHKHSGQFNSGQFNSFRQLDSFISLGENTFTFMLQYQGLDHPWPLIFSKLCIQNLTSVSVNMLHSRQLASLWSVFYWQYLISLCPEGRAIACARTSTCLNHFTRIRNCCYIHTNDIVGLYDVLWNFPFAKSEAKHDYLQ